MDIGIGREQTSERSCHESSTSGAGARGSDGRFAEDNPKLGITQLRAMSGKRVFNQSQLNTRRVN
jgi:hypothetical protein